jgi:hypothetical protein
MSSQPSTSSIGKRFLVDQIRAQIARTPAARWTTSLSPIAVRGMLAGFLFLALGEHMTRPLGLFILTLAVGWGVTASRAALQGWLTAQANRSPLAHRIDPALVHLQEATAQNADRDTMGSILRQEISVSRFR